METTTIQLKEGTLSRLKYFKDYSKESYDEILNKLINLLEEEELTEFAIKKINLGLKDIQEGRVVSLESYAKKRGLHLK
ncbi:MAG: hypothetical protein PHD81_04095 [Candidatus Nanoarchaeia archaeon]|nr:hypothetical protein [Candidatus Nanoarchaeia archaeon]MDD5588263.1 hypothetical protein [Candidatus Nanoarchaeia archaeon]